MATKQGGNQSRDGHGRFARADGTNKAVDSTISNGDVNSYLSVREQADSGVGVAYNKSLNRPVLHPTDSLQNKLNETSVEYLYKAATTKKLNSLSAEQREELKKTYASYERANERFKKQTENVASTVKLSSEQFLDQLAYAPASSNLLGTFNTTHLSSMDELEEADTTSAETKIEFAKASLAKAKTEEKFKALVSSYLVGNRSALKI